MAAPRLPLPYWMNADGSSRELCAAPAGRYVDDDVWVPSAAVAMARPLVILNPEDDEDLSTDGGHNDAPPSPVLPVAEEEQPVPPLVEPQSPWTVWAMVPDPARLFIHSYSVKEWRFKFANPESLHRRRLVVQVKLFCGGTETYIVPLEQLKQVRAKQYADDATYRVVLDMTKNSSYGVWNPGLIRFTFTNEENALAFQDALMDYLVCA